jgi:glycerol uptake facilitator-like aquaporin
MLSDFDRLIANFFLGLLYWIAQCLGGICGSILIHLTLPDSITDYVSYGATTLPVNGINLRLNFVIK